MVLDASGFELLADGTRVGRRRVLSPADVAFLHDVAARYAQAVYRGGDMSAFLVLGRELYAWLDGDGGQFAMLLSRARRPVVFEVRTVGSPSEAGWPVGLVRRSRRQRWTRTDWGWRSWRRRRRGVTTWTMRRRRRRSWGQIGDIAYDRGELDEAFRIRREVQLPVYERLGDIRAAAIAWGNIADIAYQRGELDEALRIRREVQLPVYERLGDIRAAAIAWGNIADIAHRRGELDEALRIRREVQLPVYERLGDTRSTAITWGKIADIAHQRGDHDTAATLRQRSLELYQHLGDLDGIANASCGLARIDLDRDDHPSAIPRLADALQIVTQLQQPDGIAVVGYTLGQLLLAAGHAEAAEVLTASADAAAEAGLTDIVHAINDLLPQLDQDTRSDRHAT
ncbi:tetratricopeptide repeat protein [Dactylosporangium sp. CA-139066]|uniref:tetratricopeptide repeat protein n=1 Tax=Dactylosporangium sp. CA-139066 TaxID=3239930 RepID=UPI003D8BCCA8